MKESRRINTNSLQRDAEKSEDKEAFAVLAKTPCYRVGVGARLESRANPTFFVEIIMSLCASRQEVNLHLLERNLVALKKLKKRGYQLASEGDGTIVCELPVKSENLTTEYDAARLIVEEFATRNEQSSL
jgi:hypothetical protein